MKVSPSKQERKVTPLKETEDGFQTRAARIARKPSWTSREP